MTLPTNDIPDDISPVSDVRITREKRQYERAEHQESSERPKCSQHYEGVNIDPDLLPRSDTDLEMTVAPVDFVSDDQNNLLMSMDQAMSLSPDTLDDLAFLSYSAQTAFSFGIQEEFLEFMPMQNFHPAAGFLPVQIDPVEKKCADIREIIRESSNGVIDEVLMSHITRANLVQLIEVYGRHYQPNIPILHGPTFCLVDESPVLLLAMMLVGACYSGETTISTPVVNRLAMILLGWIDNQPVRPSSSNLYTC